MADTKLLEKVLSLQDKFASLQEQLSSPDVMSDMKKYVQLNKDYKELEPIIKAGLGYKKALDDIASAKEILQTEKDEDLRDMAKEELQMGRKVSWCPGGDLSGITAKRVAEALRDGDPLARKVYDISARHLGMGLSIVIDILNPEMIVIGSIYARNEDVFQPLMREVINIESLPLANKVCRIVPAALGESIGDYAALSIAANIQ